MNVTNIDIDRSIDREEYKQSVRFWFDNGGSIRLVWDEHDRVTEQAFKPDDPHSVWDDAIIDNNITSEEDFMCFCMETIEIMLDQLNDEYSEYSLLEAVTGNGKPTPTNVEYQQ